MNRKLLPLLVAAAAAAAVLLPVHLVADIASCSVNVSSYADSVLNPSRGEDTEFFVSTGGVPNVMFVLDTSSSMRRLPPDGAATGWGSFGATYGCANVNANTRTFASACGTTTLEGSRYNPTPGFAPPDFANAKDSTGAYCPYMVSGNQAPKTDLPGFDPDFYGGGGSSPWFFEPAKVYHDALVIPDATKDGWTDWTTSPASYATYGDFCDQWAATPAKAASCSTCMRDQGYFFDGSYYAYQGDACRTTADCQARNAGTCLADTVFQPFYDPTRECTAASPCTLSHCHIPNVWFSGNFLNFYPPKFIVARKVLKDVLQSVRKVRLGLTIFDSGGNGGVLLEGLNPPCNLTGSPSNFDSNRGAILSAINSKNKVAFSGGTPLAETLLNVGQLYLSSSQTWFNSDYSSSSFQEKSGQNKSMCFSCQASAAVLITDGLPTYDGKIPGTDFATSPMTLDVANKSGSIAGMSGYNITGISSGSGADCETCGGPAEAADTSIAAGACVGQQRSGACDDLRNPIPSYLPKVAWYLNHLDFRPDGETGSDGMPFTKKQSLTTYAIGLGTRGSASTLLSDTATAGNGLYNEATDAKTLKDAIMRVLEDVNTRSTSFGAASLSTLQIASSQGVLIPRFEPARTAHWDGHLYAFDLYSEFAGGCRTADPSVSGPANGDYDCDGKCSSVFLKDADGSFIQEDGTGAFKKNIDRNKAACGNGSLCGAANCSGPDLTAAATPFWDAGAKLAPVKTTVDPVSGARNETDNKDYKPWTDRKIYTVIDADGDKRLAWPADPTIEFTAANAAVLAPYLNIQGSRYCSKLASKLTELGNPAGATIATQVAAGTYTACAEAVIQYVRGADVLNERKCTTYPAQPYCTRKYQLGDIFHSSPVEVWPPLASDSYSCPRGLHPQCLQSLFSGSIPNPATVSGNANAYDDYAKNDRYKNRKKFVLVGANDGMLHAFRIERGTPADAAIAGEELFGFVPPDLLPKLRLMVNENVHQFYVDATPMVRDVWLDGVSNALGSGNKNGVREKAEFHTIAVVGERRGGTHYFALDVTEILAKGTEGSESAYKPTFMWLYPQPNDPESLAFGETYVEFVPKPPPIGPIKIDRGAPPCPTNIKEDPDGSGRCFEERWVVFLSGGFDPQFTKGRGVHMVALDTGDEVFDFSQPPGPANLCDATKDPRCHLNYPVAATVGMMMWGKQPTFMTSAAVNGYFDTATFGDVGGQLWVLRFNEPGKLDPSTNKVTNWYGARALQHGRDTASTGCGLGYCDSQPFFYINSNVALAANGLYRTLAGTGDRFNVLDPVGGTCGPDNIRACLLKGCTVTIGDGAGGPGAVYGVDGLLGTQTYSAQHPATCTAVDPSTYRYDVTAPTADTCSAVTSKIDAITITCPSTKTCSGATETTRKRASIVCTSASCDSAASNEYGIPIDTKGNPDKRNWFFSVLVFEKTGARTIFRTLDEAKAYDAARLAETDLKNVNAADFTPTPANLASPDGKGWSYFFDHGSPSTVYPSTLSIAGVNHSMYRTDERNASVSAVEYGCAFWNTLQTGVPVGAVDATTQCPIDSPCKAGRAQISYLYGANAGTGALCLKVNGVDARAQKNETLVPPHIGKLVAYVGEGQVAFGLTSVRVPQGGANVQLGDVQDIAAATEWLPIDRTNHKCRHAPKETAGAAYTGPPSNDICRP